MKRFLPILTNRDGAAAAEYALALAIIGAAMTFGALALGTAISNNVGNGSECISATTLPPADC